MSNKTDRQILTELLNSLMDEEIVFVRERLSKIYEDYQDESLKNASSVYKKISPYTTKSKFFN